MRGTLRPGLVADIERALELHERIRERFGAHPDFCLYVLKRFMSFEQAVTEFPAWKLGREKEARRQKRQEKKGQAA